ncbi:hypothetical protein FA13DRAFT_223613 [Coprinellus micaceus]|uniref:Uncharacterized protein n=1 Tax=Coprinellus micaceus TaxID=71717 RepID=A0A4Y7TEX3_COPMI|nr:hypothetical protein FA13DRAFT_223613 [Coprinellus micaceus]
MTGLTVLDSSDSVVTLGSARRLGPLAHFAVHLIWAFLLGGLGCNSIQTTLRLSWDGAYAPIFSSLLLISMGWWMEWDRRQVLGF